MWKRLLGNKGKQKRYSKKWYVENKRPCWWKTSYLIKSTGVGVGKLYTNFLLFCFHFCFFTYFFFCIFFSLFYFYFYFCFCFFLTFAFKFDYVSWKSLYLSDFCSWLTHYNTVFHLYRKQSLVLLCKRNKWFLHETQHWTEMGKWLN